MKIESCAIFIKISSYSTHPSDVKTVYTLEQIQKILPHRYPFALVDKVIELVLFYFFRFDSSTKPKLVYLRYEAGKRAVGVKCISFNEPQFGGHFPDRPIMPGVLQVEALAQLAGIVCLQMEGAAPG